MNENIKEIINEVTEKIQKSANVKVVFGDPAEKGDITVIPVAQVCVKGLGYGCMDDDEDKKDRSGMGLGIRAKAVPVGYIEITPEGAQFVEIIEKKRIIFAAIGIGVFALFTIYRKINKMLKE